MSSNSITTSILFFDSEKVLKTVDAGVRNALIPLGAEMRTKGRYAMRPARRIRKSEVTPEIARMMGLDPVKFREQLKTYRKKLPYKASDRNEAPRTRKKKSLKRLLFFRFDPATKSVVTGPVHFGPGGAKAIEHGGMSTIRTRRPKKTKSAVMTPRQAKGLAKARAAGKIRTRKRSRRPTKYETVSTRVRIEGRRHMTKQLDAILPKIPKQFAGLIRS